MKKRRQVRNTRYVGIEFEKGSWEAAFVNSRGKYRKISGNTNAMGRQVLYRKLCAQDKVALAAVDVSYDIAREIEAAARCKVYVIDLTCLPPIFGEEGKEDCPLKLAHIVKGFHEDQLPASAVLLGDEELRRQAQALYKVFRLVPFNPFQPLYRRLPLLDRCQVFLYQRAYPAGNEQFV